MNKTMTVGRSPTLNQLTLAFNQTGKSLRQYPLEERLMYDRKIAKELGHDDTWTNSYFNKVFRNAEQKIWKEKAGRHEYGLYARLLKAASSEKEACYRAKLYCELGWVAWKLGFDSNQILKNAIAAAEVMEPSRYKSPMRDQYSDRFYTSPGSYRKDEALRDIAITFAKIGNFKDAFLVAEKTTEFDNWRIFSILGKKQADAGIDPSATFDRVLQMAQKESYFLTSNYFRIAVTMHESGLDPSVPLRMVKANLHGLSAGAEWAEYARFTKLEAAIGEYEEAIKDAMNFSDYSEEKYRERTLTLLGLCSSIVDKLPKRLEKDEIKNFIQ